ncbi:CdaR family transcriptional regulator [Caldalkalibacillus mannanilyticus]|uniref:CdaR family transcriptional regulator n=1 Tax=Caldalkalibacillus mannanilyticus TaxID=1418 RepID=UPI000469EC85|nr:sugar diacid recognition domain-containing protein [Caldalkalibacillus mannanilyticus]
MQLVQELAQKIIKEVQAVLNENIIVVNQQGMIIASTDRKRVGSLHEGALEVLSKKEKLYIFENSLDTLQGVKPGINLPIFYEKEIIGVIGITGNPLDIEPYAEIIRRMTELIIREATHIERKEWETRGIESFCYEWIYHPKIEPAFIEKGRILGIDLDQTYLCVLFQLDLSLKPEELQRTQAYLLSLLEQRLYKKRHDVLIPWGQGRLLLLKRINHDVSIEQIKYQLSKWHQNRLVDDQISIAIGMGITSESKDLFRSYHEAKKALAVAQKQHTMVYYEELLLDIVLEEVSQQTKEEFLGRVLSPIQQETDLIATLHVLLSTNHSLKKTAEELHIHINTLHYRLNQIKEMTGIDPKSTEGIVLFHVALSFYHEIFIQK